MVLALSHTDEAILSIFPNDEVVPVAVPELMKESMKITRSVRTAFPS